MKVKTYALVDIQTSIVTNTIMWDGLPSWSPAESHIAVELTPEQPAGLGWIYADGVFAPPPPSEEP